jgi:hydrogenase/urease accessory protein HupE
MMDFTSHRVAWRLILRCCCLVVLPIFFVVRGSAHDPALSAVKVMLTGNEMAISVTVHQLALEKAAGHRLDPVDTDIAIRSRIFVYAGSERVEAKMASLDVDTKGGAVTWSTRLPWNGQPVSVRQAIFPDDPAAKSLVTIYKDGRAIFDTVYDSRTVQLAPTGMQSPEAWYIRLLRFTGTGIHHIFIGIDHVCFVIGLVLLGGSVRGLLRVVTSFTIAHSITLALAALGVVNISARIVEPLIAISITGIAIDNVFQLRRPDTKLDTAWKHRVVVTFAFGLLHGFGFAGALGTLDVRGAQLATGLWGFNLGVELGQLVIVLCCAPLIGIIVKKYPIQGRILRISGSIAIGLAGFFWFVQRISAG